MLVHVLAIVAAAHAVRFAPVTPFAPTLSPLLNETRIAGALSTRGITPDARQREAISALVASLGAQQRARHAWSTAAFAPQGVYCHGLPGRGKSLVVDTSFELASCRKRRLHFHEFLREMNRRLVHAPRSDDRLGEVSRQWLDGIELLCFDEFHVHDIADAFLMGRFLDTAIDLGTRIVLTSNYAPDDLLPDPEFHGRFAPTIAQIKRCFTVIHFDRARDYRFGGEAAEAPRFFAPLDASSEAALRDILTSHEPGATLAPLKLSAAGRPLAAVGGLRAVVRREPLAPRLPRLPRSCRAMARLDRRSSAHRSAEAVAYAATPRMADRHLL